MLNENRYRTELSRYRIECANKMTGKVLGIGGGWEHGFLILILGRLPYLIFARRLLTNWIGMIRYAQMHVLHLLKTIHLTIFGLVVL